MEELTICKICGEKVNKLNHFYRFHELTLAEYCIKYFDRKDLYDNSPIPFKNPDQYFSVDFVNKNNLKKYLSKSKDRAADYCKNLIRKRVLDKDLKYSPLQIELVSLPCFPPIHYLSTLFDYYGFCEEIGLINKVKPMPPNFSIPTSEPLPESHILIDSRESQPLKFNIEYRVQKLKFGDYYFTGNPGLYFERKSINDFLGTMSQGYDRFVKELDRASAANAYLVMIIESKLSDVLSFNHLPWMKRVKTKASPEFIFHQLRSLIQQFPNFQPIFVEGRREAVEYMMKGFLSGDVFKQYDLQLLYQLNKSKS